MSGTATEQSKLKSEKIGLKRHNNLFFVTYDGKNAGFGQIQKDANDEKCVRLISLNIREDLRNHGLGTNLLQYIIEITRMIGFEHLALFAEGRCTSLYERFGFCPSGKRDDELIVKL